MKMLLATSQMYSKLFRPWDGIGGEENDQVKKRSYEERRGVGDQGECENTASTVGRNDESRVRKSGGEKANKLRKIRNQARISSSALHQDCTISTTTEEASSPEESSSAGRVETAREALEARLGALDKSVPSDETKPGLKRLKKNEDSFRKFPKSALKITDLSKCKEESASYNASPLPLGGQMNYLQFSEVLMNPEYLPYPMEGYSPQLQRYPMELLTQADLAQALGIPPTDPMLIESFAQGYAMELEYARILDQENRAKLLNARKQRPKKYRCPHCDVGFSNNGQLKGHIRIHTGERPYKCDDKACGKTFTRNEELTRHRRIHSGLRPYPCQACGKKFGRRDHLKKHTRTHAVQAERMLPMFVPLPQLAAYPYGYGY